MNKAKLESMCRKESANEKTGDIQSMFLSTPCTFSMFNRQTEYPFDPMPNVFKVAPGGGGIGGGEFDSS